MSYNEHTKKKMQTGVPTDEYRDNYDAIFGKKPKTTGEDHQRKQQEREQLQKEWDASKSS